MRISKITSIALVHFATMQLIYNSSIVRFMFFQSANTIHVKAESHLSLLLLNIVHIFVITKFLLLFLPTRDESHYDNLDYFIYFNNKWVTWLYSRYITLTYNGHANMYCMYIILSKMYIIVMIMIYTVLLLYPSTHFCSCRMSLLSCRYFLE